MYLQDYQRIGGIFVPDKVLKCSLRKVRMRGMLYLQGDTYYIHICARNRRLTKITRICGQTVDDVIISKQKLQKIYSDAVQRNLFGLHDVVRGRQLRFFLWLLCIVCNIVSLFMAGFLISSNINNSSYILFLLCNIGAIVYSILYKESFICGKITRKGELYESK